MSSGDTARAASIPGATPRGATWPRNDSSESAMRALDSMKPAFSEGAVSGTGRRSRLWKYMA